MGASDKGWVRMFWEHQIKDGSGCLGVSDKGQVRMFWEHQIKDGSGCLGNRVQ